MEIVTLTRRPDWPACLAAWFERSRHLRFAWGVHDCCLWSAAGVCAITDVFLAADLRGKYSTRKESEAVLRAHYQSTDVWDIPAAHGLKSQPVARASRADLVGAVMNGRHSLGMCGGRKSAFLGKEGPVWVETLDCERSWRIG